MTAEVQWEPIATCPASAFVARNGWLPIESAPKDGSRILVGSWHEEPDGGEILWSETIVWWEPTDPPYDTGWFDGYFHSNPDYWRFLPEPPRR